LGFAVLGGNSDQQAAIPCLALNQTMNCGKNKDELI
jgi:hypothetical protein